MDDVGLELCNYQSDMFKYSLDYFACSSSYFIKAFMNSRLAKRMDNPLFVLESIDIYAAFDELLEHYKLNRGNEKYPSYIMEWIGYIYRYFSYIYNFSSKRVYEIIKPKELYGLYEAYHSLDPKEAIKRIVEAKKIKTNIDLVELAKKYYL